MDELIYEYFIKVYGIIDEMMIGGEIMETSKSIIMGIIFFGSDII